MYLLVYVVVVPCLGIAPVTQSLRPEKDHQRLLWQKLLVVTLRRLSYDQLDAVW